MQRTFMAGVVDFMKTMAIAGFVAFFCIRGFIFEPFKIPSGSMMPTLLVGDFLFVSKYAYGNRLPLTDWFFWEKEPVRGDIVVFKSKETDLPGSFFGLGDTLFIKRLVAVPGDKIAYDGLNKVLLVNGQPAVQSAVGTFTEGAPYNRTVELKNETLEGVSHSILLDPNVEGVDVAETTVPEGMYVVMGDNRDNSRDARFWKWPQWGFVPKADLMGRAEFIFLSLDENWMPRMERFGQKLGREAGPVATTAPGVQTVEAPQ